MAEILAKQYCSVHSRPQYPDTHPHDLFPNEPLGRSSITKIIFSDEELEAAMNDFSINSTAGPDQMVSQPFYLRNVEESLHLL